MEACDLRDPQYHFRHRPDDIPRQERILKQRILSEKRLHALRPFRFRRLCRAFHTHSKSLACAQSIENGSLGRRKIRIGALFSKDTHAAQDVVAASVTEPKARAAVW